MVISRNNDMPIFAYHIGFSVNHGAVQCWKLDASHQAKIRELIHEMAYIRKK